MDLSLLDTVGDYIWRSGTSLDMEKRLLLQSSLTIMQNEGHFQRMELWGRIFGTDRDYYIACGTHNDYLTTRTFMYSNDCLTWGLMPTITAQTQTLVLTCPGRFVGDPSAEVESGMPKEGAKPSTIGGGDEPGPEEGESNMTLVKEEDRLVAVVREIDQEVAVAPRGAVIKTGEGIAIVNKAFRGLNKDQAIDLSNYLHLKKIPPPKSVPEWTSNLLLRSDGNPAYDFMDPLSDDIPQGCWVLNMESNDKLAVLRSLLWPGMTAFHTLGTPAFGFFYAGLGLANPDLPHMLY